MSDVCVPPTPLPPSLTLPIRLPLYRGNKKAADTVSGLFYFMKMLKGSSFHVDHTRELAKYGVNWVLWNSKPSGTSFGVRRGKNPQPA